MIIGVPKETLDQEYRVALTPPVCRLLIGQGHEVVIERGAGEGAGYPDAEFRAAGASIVHGAVEAWSAQLVVKVKQTLPPEYQYLREDLLLYSFLHLAAEPELTRELVQRGVTAVAAETIQTPDGALPALAPMSEIAGKMTLQVAAQLLSKPGGGIGKLISGVMGVPPAQVLVVGGGNVGAAAARMFLGVGAQVTVVDTSVRRLTYLEEVLQGRIVTMLSNEATLAAIVPQSDVLVGAVLVPGGAAPKVVREALVRSMRPGSVIVDVAIDQGGCVETSHPTHHSNPTYQVGGVIHYCVVNMPGAVPRTASHAYAVSSYPYVARLAAHGVSAVTDPTIKSGINVHPGEVTHPAVAQALGYTPVPLV